MTNEKVIFERIKNKLDGMTRTEQIIFLKKMGFEVEDDINYEEEQTLKEKVNNLQCIWAYEINCVSLKQKFLTEMIAILGYNIYSIVRPGEDEQTIKEENTEKNTEIVACIYPSVSFEKMLNLFKTKEEKEEFINNTEELLNKYKKEYKVNKKI